VSATDDLPRLLDLLDPDADAVETGRRRMEAVWKGECPDQLPITFSTPVPELEGFRRPTSAEIQADPAAMLVDQLFDAIGHARSRSDAQITVRPNVGTPFVATLFGLEAEIIDGTLPWLKERLSKSDIAAFEPPPDLAAVPAMRRVLDIIAFYRERLDGRAHVVMAATQGPFDIAHLVRGNEIFLDLYDDPLFVEHLMELTTHMYIEATRLMRRACGEEELDGASYHIVGGYVGRGTSRACEDTTTLLSPEHVQRFAAPYTRRAFEAMGEGWVHYCGSHPSFERLFVDEMPAARGLNLGNPERYDLPSLVANLASRGKVYWGGWPRNKNEPLDAYFRRVLEPTRATGCGLVFQQPELSDEESREPARVLDTWAAAHDGAAA